MQVNWFSRLRDRFGKWALIVPAAVMVLALLFIVYFNLAFPRTRCEAVKHLEAPEIAGDCYGCHVKSTPKVAQDWYESKHGVQLVKCFVCHGQPDGKGTIKFAVSPAVEDTCIKCHDPSIQTMAQKFGITKACAECHPFHQNSIHHRVYVKPVAKKTVD
jgi:hypothetical protein